MKIVNNKITQNGHVIEVGDYSITREIVRGANGIVFEADDNLLDRKVAIKIWTKLKPNDRRDKIQQGIAEARKAYQAKREEVAEIYHAGITSNLFLSLWYTSTAFLSESYCMRRVFL